MNTYAKLGTFTLICMFGYMVAFYMWHQGYIESMVMSGVTVLFAIILGLNMAYYNLTTKRSNAKIIRDFDGHNWL